MGILTANMQKQLQQKKGTEMEQKVQCENDHTHVTWGNIGSILE